MIDLLTSLTAAFGLGAALGLLHFGGLWWTVRGLAGSPRPGLRIALSFALRNAALLAGLYWLVQADWRLLLAALAGVLVVRVLWVRRVRAGTRPQPATGEPVR